MIWKVGKPFTGLAGVCRTLRTHITFLSRQKVRKKTEIGPFLHILQKISLFMAMDEQVELDPDEPFARACHVLCSGV